MNEKDYDSLLFQALQAYQDEQLSRIPPENEIDYEFSDAFRQSSQKLIEKQKGARRTFSVWAKRAAVFFLVLAVVVGTGVGTNAGRRPELNFKYSELSDEGEMKFYFYACLYDEIETQYLPEMPDDLTAVKGNLGDVDDIATTQWFNSQGEMISLRQFARSEIWIDDVQYNSLTTPVINGIRVLLLSGDDGYSVYWAQNGYFFEMWLSSYYETDLIYSTVGKLQKATDVVY